MDFKKDDTFEGAICPECKAGNIHFVEKDDNHAVYKCTGCHQELFPSKRCPECGGMMVIANKNTTEVFGTKRSWPFVCTNCHYEDTDI